MSGDEGGGGGAESGLEGTAKVGEVGWRMAGSGLCLQPNFCGSRYTLAVMAKCIRSYWSLLFYRRPALLLWSSGFTAAS